jgi:uncharacterized repeat protein (TIGR01451 family)
LFTVSANANASFDGLGEDITPTATCGAPAPTIDLTKSVSVPVICPGGTADFTLVVTNTGNVDLTNVTVVDNLPAGLVYQETVSNTCGGAVNANGAQITYGPFNLAVDASCTIVIRVGRTAEAPDQQRQASRVPSSACRGRRPDRRRGQRVGHGPVRQRRRRSRAGHGPARARRSRSAAPGGYTFRNTGDDPLHGGCRHVLLVTESPAAAPHQPGARDDRGQCATIARDGGFWARRQRRGNGSRSFVARPDRRVHRRSVDSSTGRCTTRRKFVAPQHEYDGSCSAKASCGLPGEHSPTR